jgi:signal transduction histidine kinase
MVTVPDQSKLFDMIVKKAIEITDAEFGEIWLLDVPDQKLVLIAGHPQNISAKASKVFVKMGEGIIGLVGEQHQTILVGEVQEDPRCTDCDISVHSVLCVPLLSKEGQLIGVLKLGSMRSNAFTPGYQTLLEDFANRAVMAIQGVNNEARLIRNETMATFGELISPLVHDANNDIGAIGQHANQIQKSEIGNEALKKAASDIEFLAKQTLDKIGKICDWVSKRKHTPVNLARVLSMAMNSIFPIPDGIRVNDLPDDLPKVMANEDQLKYTFAIIIQNAIDAMPNGGNIFFDAKCVKLEKKDWVQISVQDTGVGIEERNLDKIFDLGFSTKERTEKRLGFGLWWAKAYIEDRLSGYIKVNSKLNEGTHFIISLQAYEQK